MSHCEAIGFSQDAPCSALPPPAEDSDFRPFSGESVLRKRTEAEVPGRAFCAAEIHGERVYSQ